jgi:N-acetylglucosaminyldiphosphoundecaprenol N-acetyl-beta-D-mannosaminyltransferase
VAQRQPSYLVSANLNTLMLANQDTAFREAVVGATCTLADGMPLVWATRLRKVRLPERVAGSDLVPAVCGLAAARGFRVFLLGGVPGAAEEAARELQRRYPGILIAGTEAPPFRALSAEEERALLDRIRDARADFLFVSFGSPKGELWVKKHYQALAVPVCVQVGATIDFLAGRGRRCPRWLQLVGLEWAYRLYQEPRRLYCRYARNAAFLLRMLLHDACTAFLAYAKRPDVKTGPEA